MSATAYLRAYEYASICGEEYTPEYFDIVFASMRNNLELVQELIEDTHFSPVELIECIMYKWITVRWSPSALDTFEFLLSLVTPEEINEPFVGRDGVTHTLVTWFCYTIETTSPYVQTTCHFKEKLAALTERGADLRQLVNGKTGASYLVRQHNVSILTEYMNYGGSYTDGYLLVNSINLMTEEKLQELQQWYRDSSGEMDLIDVPRPVWSPWTNMQLFVHLCLSGVNPNEIEPESGMNALIATCSEGCWDRLNALIGCFPGLFHLDIDAKTREGKTAMDWALRTDIPNFVYRLEIYMQTKKNELKEVMYVAHVDAVKNNQTMVWGKCDRTLFDKIISPFLG